MHKKPPEMDWPEIEKVCCGLMTLHYMQIVTGHCGCCILQTKNGGHIPIVVQVQSQAYVMVSECVRGHGTPNLFICEGIIYAEMFL